MYRLFYWTKYQTPHGAWFTRIEFIVIDEPVGRIEAIYKNKIYLLTDMCGNVIIDNRKRKREEKW